MKRQRSRGFRQWLIRGILLVVFIIMAVPLFVLLVHSLMGRQELLETCGAVLADYGGYAKVRIFPTYPTLRAYVRLLLDSPEYFTAFWNSMIQTVGVLLGQLLTAVPAAWAFAKFSFRGRRALYLSYVILMLMPFSVMMLPSYLVLNGMRLMDTHWAVILPAMFSTFPVFLMYRGFAAIPKDLYEAAKIDGANEWQVFWQVGLPLGSPGILSALVLGFLEYWNMVEQPLAFLAEPSRWPLSLYLPEIDLQRAGIAMAASVITRAPAVFVFFMGQDYLEQGIVASGMKE